MFCSHRNTFCRRQNVFCREDWPRSSRQWDHGSEQNNRCPRHWFRFFACSLPPMANPHLPHWGDADVSWNGLWTWPTPAELAAANVPPTHQTKHRTKNKMAHRDYVPQSYPNLLAWLIKQETELTAQLATDINMSAADRTKLLAAVAVIKTQVAEIVDLMDSLEEKTADFPMILDQQMPIVRAVIKKTKADPLCLPSVVTQLDWEGDAETFNPETARPFIAAEAQPGRVKISGRKPGFDLVNIYHRKKGDVLWKVLVTGRQRFPFYDEAPLTVPGTPEVREYMARGVINDEEVGQPSEIREAVFAG